MRIVLPIGFILALIGAYGWLWLATAARLEEGLETWMESRRAAGLEADYDRVRITGFPYRLTMSVERPRIAGPRIVGARAAGFRRTASQKAARWRWQGERLLVHALPLQSSHVIIEATGEHALTIERHEGERINLTDTIVTAEAARASFVRTRGELGRLAIDVQGLAGQQSIRVQTTDEDKASPSAKNARKTFSIERVQLHSAPDDAKALDTAQSSPGAQRRVILRAEGARSGAPLVPGLGTTVERTEGRFIITGIPGEMARTHGWFAAQTLQAWRSKQGEITVDGLSLDWAPISASATGALTLDRRGRPQGSLDLRVEHPGEILTGLAGNGLVDHSFAALVRSVLSLLITEDDQPAEQVALPLTLKNGMVELAGMRVGATGTFFHEDPETAPE